MPDENPQNLNSSKICTPYTESVLNSLPDAVLIVDREREILFANPAAGRLLAKPLDDIVGSKFDIAGNAGALDEISLARGDGKKAIAEIRSSHMTWRDKPCELISLRDISTDHEIRKTLDENKQYDPQTGLYNEATFTLAAGQALSRILSEKGRAYCVGIRIRRLQDTVSEFGAEGASTLITKLAERLRRSLPENVLLAHTGHGHFLCFGSLTKSTGQMAQEWREMGREVQKPVKLAGREVSPACLAAISIAPDDGRSLDQLRLNITNALRTAAAKKGSVLRYYDKQTEKSARRNLKLTSDLKEALDDKALKVYYQPKLDVHDGQAIGAEALVRWPLPGGGHVSPAEFIPLAEQSGLIRKLGRFVRETVAGDMAEIAEQCGCSPSIHVNISGRELAGKRTTEGILDLLSQYRIDPDRFTLEITETYVGENLDRIEKNVHKLAEAGFKFALDDFGTGYSSLSQLSRLPFHYLKIDKSFVDHIVSNRQQAAIARGTIGLAKALDMTVVAEGVENREQLLFLQAYDCDHYQGYHFSPALPKDEFINMTREHNLKAA